MIAYRCQYEPHHRAMIQQVRNKSFGTVKLIQADNGQNQGGDLNQWRLKRSLAGEGHYRMWGFIASMRLVI